LCINVVLEMGVTYSGRRLVISFMALDWVRFEYVHVTSAGVEEEAWEPNWLTYTSEDKMEESCHFIYGTGKWHCELVPS